MVIKIENYEMEQEGTRFNLKWFKTSTKKVFQGKGENRTRIDTGEEVIVETPMGYGMTLERCLSMIVGNELTIQDRTISLKEWLKEYQEITEKFTKIFQQIKL